MINYSKLIKKIISFYKYSSIRVFALVGDREIDPKMQLHRIQLGAVYLYGVRIVSLVMEGHERLCLAQISNTLLKDYSYNEIHNRRVALGITCVQCTPVQVRASETLESEINTV